MIDIKTTNNKRFKVIHNGVKHDVQSERELTIDEIFEKIKELINDTD